MKYNPKEEMTVLMLVKELGLCSPEEIMEQTEKYGIAVSLDHVKLILERWKAKDAITTDLSMGEKRYKLAKIPPSFQSLKMENVIKIRLADATKIIAELEQEFPDGGPPVKCGGSIGNYKTLAITFEAIDPILGGTPEDGEIELKVHRNSAGKLVISPAQMKGWFRENLRLLDINPNAHSWMGFTDAVAEEDCEIVKKKAPIVIKGRGGCGLAHYEAFEAGTKFKTVIRVPLRGVGIKTVEDIQKLFELCEVCPKRGLGANPFYYGGKIRLLEMQTIA